MKRGEWLLVAAAVMSTLAVFAAVFRMNDSLGGSIQPFGWFAYAAGGLMSLLVAGLLFFLVFHSARHGYDDLDRPDDEP